MSVIIRLQNLPWSANALDIRQFFHGLSIPEGGVHIVGGELGDAFIAFSTDEDARQAFNRNGGKIKEIQVKLMLSSRTEMQKVIEAARNPLAAFMPVASVQTAVTSISSLIPTAVPLTVPEIKKDDYKEKDRDRRDKRRSRSRSRDRKERSRDRDRRDKRRRDRSRSRSRDRKDRRRRDRSRSRDRARSKDRDRRSKDRRRSEEKTTSSSSSSASNLQKDTTKHVGVWETPILDVLAQQQPTLLSNFIPNNLEEARRNLNALNQPALAEGNIFINPRDNFGGGPKLDNWPLNAPLRQNNEERNDFNTRRNQNFSNSNDATFQADSIRQNGPQFQNSPSFLENNRSGFNRPQVARQDGRNSRLHSDRPPLLECPQMELRNLCVQLRPFFGGYGEIRRFFQGIFINNTGIKFVNDDYGKRTGLVYVRFAYPEGREKALQRNGGFLKHNKVEVLSLEDEEFENTIDRYQPGPYDQDDSNDQTRNRNVTKYFNKTLNHQPMLKVFSCLIIEDLPSFAKEQDILKMFSDYPLVSILMVNKPRFHVGYVKFSNPEDAKVAQTEKVKHCIEGKPVIVSPCSDAEFEKVNREQNEPEEIADEKDDEEEEIDKEYPTAQSECISLSGLPPKTTDRDITDFFSDIAIVPTKIHLVNNQHVFTGEAYCEFNSVDDASVALEKDGIPLGSGTVSVKSITREEMNEGMEVAPQPAMTHPSPRPFFQRNNMGPMHLRPPIGARPPMRRFHGPPQLNNGDVGPPGCIVLMENVPYKAGLNEILEFFDGYEIQPDNVLRRYNENGTPSGEAKVIFSSPDEAFQAIKEKKFHKIRERTIFLSQC